VALAAGVGVGLSSSVIPYVTDQLAMSKLSRAAYALMVSLLPATATVIGVVVLAQVPSPAEVAGVALVVGGVALRREPADPPGEALALPGVSGQGNVHTTTPGRGRRVSRGGRSGGCARHGRLREEGT
jgi:inner membrane transporter RhtA